MPSLAPQLRPPDTKGHVSVAKLTDYWYIACPSRRLGRGPLKRTILGLPMVLFRDGSGRPTTLLDRCAHRNVPLSRGRVRKDCLECAYHGWQFDRQGICRRVPGLSQEREPKGRRVPCFATREQEGFVWVFANAELAPKTDPPSFPLLAEPGYTSVRRVVQAEGSLHAVAENALDVPHTAFLHRGLFRGGGKPNEIEVVVRRTVDRVEAEYIGEPRPAGMVGRILSPSGGVVTHVDRFILPSLIQVEYRIGDENHILVTAALTPVTDFRTVLNAVVSFRFRIPNWLIKPILTPIALRIFKQDAQILKLQTETIKAFGGEQYVSTDIDVLGRDIWRLLRQGGRSEELEQTEWADRRLRLKA